MTPELQSIPIPASFFDPLPNTRLAWIGMAGALINARGAIFLIDPLLIQLQKEGVPYCEVGYALRLPLPLLAQDLPRADYVMITHGDDDHFGPQTMQALAERTRCRFFVPPPIRQRLLALGVSADRILLAEDYMRLRHGETEIMVTPALHDWQEVDPWRRGDCCGFLLKTPDGAIWHPGDTRLIDELLAIRDVSVLFFDVAAVEAHLGPQGSAALAKSCGARALIAYHYGTFDLPPGSWGNCDPLDALPYLADVPAKYLLPSLGEALTLPLA